MDFLIFQQINNFAGRNIYLDFFGIFCAKYLGYILIFVLFLFLIKNLKKYRPMVIKILGAVILSRFLITELIRFFWQKPRPFVENNVNLLINHLPTPSFPSGHAAFFFALSTVIYFYNKKTGILFLIASSLIAISRIFCGIHWPSDILTGTLIGVFSGWLVMRIFKKY